MINPRFGRAIVMWTAVLQAGLVCCQHVALAAEEARPRVASVDGSGAVRSIELPHARAGPRHCSRTQRVHGGLCQLPFGALRHDATALTQRQWEDSVDKMVKSYGAQMDAEQRTAIVGYLVATHGPTSPTQPSQSIMTISARPRPTRSRHRRHRSWFDAFPPDAAQLSAEIKRGERPVHSKLRGVSRNERTR